MNYTWLFELDCMQSVYTLIHICDFCHIGSGFYFFWPGIDTEACLMYSNATINHIINWSIPLTGHGRAQS